MRLKRNISDINNYFEKVDDTKELLGGGRGSERWRLTQ